MSSPEMDLCTRIVVDYNNSLGGGGSVFFLKLKHSPLRLLHPIPLPTPPLPNPPPLPHPFTSHILHEMYL